MKPTRKEETEVIHIYDVWLDSYINGDIKTYDSYLDDDYRFIGSTNNEEFLNRKDTTKFLEATVGQLAGKTELRNSIKTIERIDKLFFITHLFDAYFLNGTDWNYYGRFRFTSALWKNENGWKFIYQHFSMPDTKAEAGETIGYNNVAAENLQLKEAINRRTVELEQKNKELEIALKHLKATQTQLIQSEKLASLGQLAAGIAHEIKNPMNFINNFSELSLEYVDEIRQELNKLDNNETTEEIASLLDDVTENLKKVHHHGTRADNIVKSMLLHSRGSSGNMEPTNINELIKEYVNLAFHGMRAGKTAINVKIELNLDDSLVTVDLNPEDFSRVILNLCKNAFDAMRTKGLQSEHQDYKPVLKVSTKNPGDGFVAIDIEDNGPGVSDAIKDKLFQPFFTTKKGTEGTGLGLSITYDIIKNHQGKINIESVENVFTRFEIQLPLNAKKLGS